MPNMSTLIFIKTCKPPFWDLTKLANFSPRTNEWKISHTGQIRLPESHDTQGSCLGGIQGKIDGYSLMDDVEDVKLIYIYQAQSFKVCWLWRHQFIKLAMIPIVARPRPNCSFLHFELLLRDIQSQIFAKVDTERDNYLGVEVTDMEISDTWGRTRHSLKFNVQHKCEYNIEYLFLCW